MSTPPAPRAVRKRTRTAGAKPPVRRDALLALPRPRGRRRLSPGWIVLGLAVLAGCRGGVSAEPPVKLQRDMFQQAKYRAGGESAFFADGRAMRPPPDGTVAVGALREDDAFWRGKVDGQYVQRMPVKLDEALVARGRERYGIFCASCHGLAGGGRGIVVQRGYPIAADLVSDRLRTLPDGQIFEAITVGIRNMPAHGPQIPEADRWAIVAWIRVLQRSQHAKLEDVPAAERGRIEPEDTGP